MLKWKQCERTRLWLVVRYCFLICEETGENHVKLAKRTGVLAVIRTEYLPNTNQTSASASLLN